MKATGDTTDLLVIGGGILGTFHAYHALERGLTVRLVERNTAPRGATVRNFGQVVPSGLDQHWQTFGRESLRIYQAIQERFDITVRNQGTLYIASDTEESTLIEELHERNQAVDYSSQLWTSEQCRKHVPSLRASYCQGGLFFPEEVSVNPRMMIHRLQQYLSDDSRIQLHFRTCVDRLEANADGVTATTTDGQTFKADRAIVCSGSEFQILFPELFRESDLEVVKIQMLRLNPQPEVRLPGNLLTGLSIRRYESFSECPSWNEIKSREPADRDWKRWSVHILFKQETDGGIIVGDSHEYATVDRADDLSFELSRDINDYFIAEGRKILDLPSWDVEATWPGFYCQTKHPSGILTKTVDERIHIVTGIGGKGMTSSAGFAKHHLREILG